MADDDGSSKAMYLFLDKLAITIGNYGCHQIECGAQVIQAFESWAHQLTPAQFEQFGKPATQKAIRIMKEKYPDVPVIYFANGGSSYLEYCMKMRQCVGIIDFENITYQSIYWRSESKNGIACPFGPHTINTC